jgi:hypothetical protein
MAHDVATLIRVASGPRPKTSLNFARTVVDDAALHEWHRLFRESTYWGHHFLDLEGSKGKPLLPSTHKGGPWLPVLGPNNALIACFCRCISGHALGASGSITIGLTLTGPSSVHVESLPWKQGIICCVHAPSRIEHTLVRVPPLCGTWASIFRRIAGRSPLSRVYCGIPAEVYAQGV